MSARNAKLSTRWRSMTSSAPRTPVKLWTAFQRSSRSTNDLSWPPCSAVRSKPTAARRRRSSVLETSRSAAGIPQGCLARGALRLRLRVVQVRLRGEERRELFDALLVELRDQRIHDHVDALARLVALERDLQVGLVLAREVRPLRRRGDTFGTVAGGAGGGLGAPGLDFLGGRERSRRLGLTLEGLEVRGDVGDVLVRERRRLLLHRLV